MSPTFAFSRKLGGAASREREARIRELMVQWWDKHVIEPAADFDLGSEDAEVLNTLVAPLLQLVAAQIIDEAHGFDPRDPEVALLRAKACIYYAYLLGARAIEPGMPPISAKDLRMFGDQMAIISRLQEATQQGK